MPENLLDVFTRRALKAFGHRGSIEYQRRLAEGELAATRCDDCGDTAFVGRPFCPACFSEKVQWVRIGDGATLHAFTTQSRALRFTAPSVIGVAEIPGVGLVIGPVEGRMDTLEIGQQLTVEIADIGDDLRIHRFVP